MLFSRKDIPIDFFFLYSFYFLVQLEVCELGIKIIGLMKLKLSVSLSSLLLLSYFFFLASNPARVNKSDAAS